MRQSENMYRQLRLWFSYFRTSFSVSKFQGANIGTVLKFIKISFCHRESVQSTNFFCKFVFRTLQQTMADKMLSGNPFINLII